MKLTDKLAAVNDWLISNGLDEMKLSLSTSHEASGNSKVVVELNTYPDYITSEEFRLLKRIFGPLKAKRTWNDTGMYLEGETEIPLSLDKSITVNFTLHGAYECQILNDEDRTEAKWEELKQFFLDGTLTVRDCRQRPVGGDID